LHLLFLILFFSPYLKTRFLFNSSPINILQILLRSECSIAKFIHNFVNIYFPLIDSRLLELKMIPKKHVMKFFFFKFPLLLELNFFFSIFEDLQIFLNAYKFIFLF